MLSDNTKIEYDAYLKKVFGDELEAFLHHGALSDFIRVNTMRATRDEVEEVLTRYGFETERVEGLEDALRILHAPFDPTLTLHHFAGWYVKQSLSSQLPVRFLDLHPGQTVIDLCAAPGSKTTQIATAMQNSGRLYANDLAGKRMTPLAARLDGCLVSHAVLFNKAAERLTQILPPVFDRVLADVPCTGLGNFASLDEHRMRYERAKNPLAQNELQYRIALTGCKLLKKGGRLVYSTCSLDPNEDECVVHEIVSRLPFRLLEMPDIAGIRWRNGLTAFDGREFSSEMTKARRVTPWENDTQGFFVAVLEKTDDLPIRFDHVDPQTPRTSILSAEDPVVAPILENIERYYGIETSVFSDYHFVMASRGIHCIDAHWDSIENGYHRAGLCLAKKRGGIWRLSHAMIQKLGRHITKNKIELTRTQMETLCSTGYAEVAEPPESPYPVMSYGELGCLGTTYDMQDGRIYWKRPTDFHCL